MMNFLIFIVLIKKNWQIYEEVYDFVLLNDLKNYLEKFLSSDFCCFISLSINLKDIDHESLKH